MRLDDDELRALLEEPNADWASQEGLMDSAVLVLLVERGGSDHLVLSLRRDDLRHHPGQVCFPGGTREGEEDAVACAVREACEEFGVAGEALSILGRMRDRISIEGFKVAVLVSRLTEPPPEYVPDESEVAAIFEVPLEELLIEERWKVRPFRRKNGEEVLRPYFPYGEFTIWGLTAAMLRDFLEVVR